MGRFDYLTAVLVFSIAVISDGYVRSSSSSKWRCLQQSSTVLRSIGSDQLERPEDEDSPEFREYLKQLMKMQANRAKSGFSAPSSGSSDAYVAKLNRLKMERQALRAAGLGDVELDTSYKEEDYANAVFEGQEPLVTGSVLTGDAAIPRAGTRVKSGSKVRELTPEERAAAEAAERSVQAALAKQNALPPGLKQSPSQQQPDNPYKRENKFDEKNADFDVIDNILNKKGLSKKPLASGTAPVSSSSAGMEYGRGDGGSVAEHDVAQQRSQNTARYTAAAAAVAAATAQAQVRSTPSAMAPPAPVAAANAVSSVPLRPLPPRPAASDPAPAPAPVPAPAPALHTPVTTSAPPSKYVPLRPLPHVPAPASSSVGAKLGKDDLAIGAEALKLLVAHRGGGPFGVGRLRTAEEVSSLESAMLGAVDMLTRVDGSRVSAAQAQAVVATPTAAATAAIAAAEVTRAPQPATVPIPAPIPATAAVFSPAKTSGTAALASLVQSRAPSQPAAGGAEGVEAVPIALGLDQFLQAPKQRSLEELSGLRDGLIQVLAMLQAEISNRPPAASAFVVDPSSAAARTRSAGADGDAFNRIMKLNAPAVATSTSSEMPIDQEIKLAMGLLLKHRGGPGFGHGRLLGRELDLMAEKLRSSRTSMFSERSTGKFRHLNVDDEEDVTDLLRAVVKGASVTGHGTERTKYRPVYRHPLPVSTQRYEHEQNVKRITSARLHEQVAAAVAVGDSYALEEVYIGGAPADVHGPDGYTPLHMAVARNQIDCIAILLHIGVDVNATSLAGITPLFMARSAGSTQAEIMLLEKGAQLTTNPFVVGTTIMNARQLFESSQTKTNHINLQHKSERKPTELKTSHFSY